MTTPLDEETFEFPELTQRQQQCRLCQLATTRPKVLFVVHELYRRGLTGRPLVAKLEPVFAEAGEEMPSRQAFLRHFERHCAAVAGEDAPEEVKQIQRDDYESDYIELRKLYADFREIFTQVKDEFKERKRSRSEGGEKTSDYGLVMLVKLAGELRQMLDTLSKMRNSEKLFSIVLVRHTEQVIEAIVDPLGSTLKGIRDRLKRGDDAEAVAEELTRLLNGDIYPLFEAASKRALEQSRQQYKLH